jgi:hypothetical protein
MVDERTVMKNVHVTTRELGLNIFIWLVLPLIAAFLGALLSLLLPIPGGLFTAIMGGGLMWMFISVYNLVKPVGYNRRWGWKRILIFALLISLLVLSVCWCFAEMAKPDPKEIPVTIMKAY